MTFLANCPLANISAGSCSPAFRSSTMGRVRSKVCPLRFLAPLAGPEAGPRPGRAWPIAMRSIQTDKRCPPALAPYARPALLAHPLGSSCVWGPPRHCCQCRGMVRDGLEALTQRSHLSALPISCRSSTHVRHPHLARGVHRPESPTNQIAPRTPLILAAGAYHLDIVDKGFSHSLLTSTSRPRAPGGRGDPPKPGFGGLTGYEGKRSST